MTSCRAWLATVALLALAGCWPDGCNTITTVDVDQLVNSPAPAPSPTSQTGQPLGFACQRSSCAGTSCSAITCTWQDGLEHALCAETAVVGKICEQHTSPGELDPEPLGQPRAWSVTLEQDGVVLAGPLMVETDS